MKSFIHIIPTLHSGGGEKLLALTCEFVDANHHIICLSNLVLSQRIERNGAIIYYPFKLGLGNIKIITLLFNAFLDGKYVCQGWMYYGDLIAVFIQLLSFGRIQGRLFC